ncbi:hypothetical protein [Levilactobacillus parabrevis]|uniref:phosphoribosyltransferase-like protein n=1 Tax=Levilactobacillus parabrevis TaxID=357278 RepID=UPI003756639F
MRRKYRASKKTLSFDDISVPRRLIEECVRENDTFQRYLFDRENYDEVVDRLTIEYANLGNPKMETKFCEMVRKYSYFPIEAYPDLLKRAFIKLHKDFDSKKNFNLLPVVDAQGIQSRKVKSSNLVQYLYQGTFFKTFEGNVSLTRQFSYNGKYIESHQNNPWIMVDDFVGTGQSFMKSYKYWKKRGIQVKGALVLVSTAEGFKYLKSELPDDVNIYYAEIVQKVCDNQTVIELSKALGVKQAKDNYCSGVVVTMARTPNNTVPCFFKKGSKNGRKILPPFVR